MHFGDARQDAMLFTRKQLAQLASKMRFISAQFEAMLEGDLWLENARHANAMAARLAERAAELGIEITQSVDANEVFAVLDPDVTAAAQERYAFYVWDERPHEVRWVTSWDTTEEDVDGFVGAAGRAARLALGCYSAVCAVSSKDVAAEVDDVELARRHPRRSSRSRIPSRKQRRSRRSSPLRRSPQMRPLEKSP